MLSSSQLAITGAKEPAPQLDVIVQQSVVLEIEAPEIEVPQLPCEYWRLEFQDRHVLRSSLDRLTNLSPARAKSIAKLLHISFQLLAPTMQYFNNAETQVKLNELFF